MSFVKSALVSAALVATPTVVAAVPYSNLVVFGDSLVDAGNVSIITGGAVPNPAQGYFMGRFTNGPDFTDFLNQQIEGSFTTASLAGGDNYAFGGARIVDNSTFAAGGDAIPDLDFQVAAYLAATGGSADAEALHTINMAGNDIFAIGRGETGPFTQEEYIAFAASRIVANVDALDDAGARKILVMGVPNLGATGSVELETAILAGLAAAELEAEIFNFSYFDFFTTLQTNPSALGLPVQDTTVNCIDVREVVDGEIDCTGIFSFDGVHFTAPIHEALFREVADLVGIQQVPAPGALALFGIGLIGIGIRRRVR